MAGLVPAIHGMPQTQKDEDARVIWREEALRAYARA
jgi:hypothetical protein